MTTRSRAPETINASDDIAPVCDNHPDTPAVWSSDGLKHSVISFCKACLQRYEATRAKIRA